MTTRFAKLSLDARSGKWIASFNGHVLASSKNQKYVIESIRNGRCNRANELGVSDVETVGVKEQVKSNAKVEALQAQNDKFGINERFGFVTDLVNMISIKAIPSMIITGEGGLGKTFTVMKSLKDAGMKDTRDFLTNMDAAEVGEAVWTKSGNFSVIKGFSTAKGLYRTLYENRDKICVFDDCDSVLKDPVALNLLKGALDSFDERWISWNAEPIGGDDLPRSFKFTGQVVFISNMPLMKIDQAIRSRSICVDLAMNAAQKIERMAHIAESDDFLPDFPLPMKKDALKFLEKHGESAKELSLRTLISVVKIRAQGKPNWEHLAEYVISM